MDEYLDVGALVQVVLVSLVGGVGLVALYAFGIRALAAGQEEGRRGGTAVGILSFSVVVAGVLIGLYLMLLKG